MVDRDVQDALQEAIEEAIARVRMEWTVTVIDAVGVLHLVAARLAHQAIEHKEE